MGLGEEEMLWVPSFQVRPGESSFPNKLTPLFQLELEAALAHCLCGSVAQCCCWALPGEQGVSLLCILPGRLSGVGQEAGKGCLGQDSPAFGSWGVWGGQSLVAVCTA